MGSTGLVVHRHVVDCQVVGTAADGDRAVRAVLDDDTVTRLADAVQGADGYWVIRRLGLAADVGAHWSSGQVGSRLALAFADALERRTRSHSDPEALCFPDRSAFVAQYLADLAGGRAQGRWEYAQFDRSGPGLAAVLAMGQGEPETLRAALLLLRDGELDQLARAIPPTAQEAVLAALAAPAAGSPAPVLIALRGLRQAGRLSADGAALVLALTAVREQGAELGAVVEPALALAALLAQERGAAGDWASSLSDLEQGRWDAAVQVLGPDTVLGFVRWSNAERSGLRAALTPEGGGREASGERLSTPFGGAFLLLPLVDELCDWAAVTRAWPALGPTPPAAAVRLLVLAAALGRPAAVLADEVLRLAVGGSEAEVSDLADWCGALSAEQVDDVAQAAGDRLVAHGDEHTRLGTPFPVGSGVDLVARAARSALAQLGRMLPGMAGASTPYLRENVLDLPAWLEPGEAGEPTVVELGRSALSVLVSLAGLDRGELVVRRGGEVDRWLLTPPR